MTSHTLKMSLAAAVASIVSAGLTACNKPDGAGEAASAPAEARAAPTARPCAPSDYVCNDERELSNIVQDQDKEEHNQKFLDDLNRGPAGQQPADDASGDVAKKL
jgi:hypothetical protein